MCHGCDYMARFLSEVQAGIRIRNMECYSGALKDRHNYTVSRKRNQSNIIFKGTAAQKTQIDAVFMQASAHTLQYRSLEELKEITGVSEEHIRGKIGGNPPRCWISRRSPTAGGPQTDMTAQALAHERITVRPGSTAS